MKQGSDMEYTIKRVEKRNDHIELPFEGYLQVFGADGLFVDEWKIPPYTNDLEEFISKILPDDAMSFKIEG
jgi:hypothetical protein